MAIADPLDFNVLDALRFAQDARVEEVLAIPSQLARYVEDVLAAKVGEEEDTGTPVTSILDDLYAELGEAGYEAEADAGSEAPEGAVVRLANQIILDAYQQGASDIHIEPNGKESELVVRLRVDGVCEAYQSIPSAFRNNLVARLKVMATLDIAERRKPQDGKIRFKAGDKTIELRVSTMPTVSGSEDLVMRILAASKPIPLGEMGMTQRNLDTFKNLVKRPYGLVLCVGPTGSGKTTTLHSALGEINEVGTKIWTAEDPVEITQAGLRQVQVHPKIGFGFAEAMRGFLRLDPDVIMVGEMRDFETASIGVEASLTGHLVLSTLHTNSAPETVTRLLDMGLDPFTFGDALIGVLAQRLARALCKKCRTTYVASVEEFETITEIFGADGVRRILGIGKREDLQLWRAEGCGLCKESGYKGRVAIHELLVNDADVQRAIQQKLTAAEVRDLAIAGGMQTLLEDGVQKAMDGKTDLKTVLAICRR
ncbi:MAG: type II/IV secretion system protein [Deltaproteobacteria bacterium]|nr:type II/IV secretion system protein [Deltaproteobacteria bacterium]